MNQQPGTPTMPQARCFLSMDLEDFMHALRAEQPSPFMNSLAPAPEQQHDDITAVTRLDHRDGSARFHTVCRETNPRYGSLFDRFQQKTGVPVLLNTSFNIQEPIVCTPAEAIDCYMRSAVDVLVMGDYFITRDMLPA